ncbi:MAG: apolipoprotein N-acyltransferase [Chitinispirillaceae bacterium]|nr:apolipoprotein N-acyltransferase [Chitinispirillaceae bacterium]
MLKSLLHRLAAYYLSGNRIWLPLLCGALYSFALPPFNHETSTLFALFPLLNFMVLIPLFAFAVQRSLKRALLHTYLYGYTAAFGQYHWLMFDRVEGLWLLVILGLFLASAFVALLYCAAGALFRVVDKRMGGAGIIVFPALWVLIDYARSLGELAFPWAFLGYSFTPILPFSQLASVTGVWGLTFIAVLGNTMLWQMGKKICNGFPYGRETRFLFAFIAVIVLIGAAGWYRMTRYSQTEAPQKKIALLQSNIDQFRWSNAMLDTAFAVSESLVTVSSLDAPDLMILPESALLCFVSHRSAYQQRVLSWVRRSSTSLVFGSLDWIRAPHGEPVENRVYNAAFFVKPGYSEFAPYYKVKLVPFSEALPFEGLFPILSRVNLGEADFSRGSDPVVFSTEGGIHMAPLICYESIFPEYVRSRARRGVNLLVNITNDGWFGRSSGPRHHAMMARMRCIENGVSLARCANSGISMFVDPVGRVLGETGLYERTTLTRNVPIYTIATIYHCFGDWFVGMCAVLAVCLTVINFFTRRRNPS